MLAPPSLPPLPLHTLYPFLSSFFGQHRPASSALTVQNFSPDGAPVLGRARRWYNIDNRLSIYDSETISLKYRKLFGTIQKLFVAQKSVPVTALFSYPYQVD